MNGINLNALSKLNDNPQVIPATVITTNTPVVSSVFDLSDSADTVVALALTVSSYSGAGSVKLLVEKTVDGTTFTPMSNDDLVIKDLITGLELDVADKAAAIALSGVGVSKLGFIFKNPPLTRVSIVPTGITGSVTAYVIIQYEKQLEK